MITRYRLRINALAALALVTIPVISGCSHHASTSGNPQNPTATVPIALAPAPTPQSKLVLYVLAPGKGHLAQTADANGLIPVPLPKATNENASPATSAIEALTKSASSPLPRGTKLLGLSVDQSSKTATVNFSEEFETNFKGGETREAQSVYSVVETLGQFPNVHRVQFLVAGKKIDSLGGTLELDEPLPTQQDGLQIASSSAN